MYMILLTICSLKWADLSTPSQSENSIKKIPKDRNSEKHSLIWTFMKSLLQWFIITGRAFHSILLFTICLWGIYRHAVFYVSHRNRKKVITCDSCSALIVQHSVHKTEHSQSEQNWEHVEMEIFTLLGLLGGEVGIRPSMNQATPDLACFYKWVSDCEVQELNFLQVSCDAVSQ